MGVRIAWCERKQHISNIKARTTTHTNERATATVQNKPSCWAHTPPAIQQRLQLRDTIRTPRMDLASVLQQWFDVSGAIASWTSGSIAALTSGLGVPHGWGGAERTEPVGFFLPLDGGRRGLGLGADCRFLLREAARGRCPLPSSPVSTSRTSESLISFPRALCVEDGRSLRGIGMAIRIGRTGR